MVFTAVLLFEIAVDNLEELLAGLDIGGCARKMGPDVVLYNLGQQAIHRAAAAGNALQYVGTTDFLFQRALDCLDLTSNAADPIQQLGFFTDRMAHCSTPITLVYR
jgi:hypothetical protein